MAPTAPWSGSLTAKRKSELNDITDRLGVSAPDATNNEMIAQIKKALWEREAELSKDADFKGLYKSLHARGREGSDHAEPVKEVKSAAQTAVNKGRQSINKAVEKVAHVDPTNIALPESPAVLKRISTSKSPVRRIAETSEEVSVAVKDSLAVAVHNPKKISKDLTVRVQDVSNTLTQWSSQNRVRVDQGVRTLRDFLSDPKHLLASSLGVELAFLLAHVIQFYDHTIFFPPPGGDNGTISSLLHTLFFWLPTFTLNVRLPEWNALRPSANVWPAATWWAATTVLPPLALSTLVSFVPQHGVSTGHNTRYSSSHPPLPTVDPLVFSLIRLAVLCFPLTSAAPDSLVDSLQLSGNLQGRALAGALVVGLMLAERL